VQNVGTTSPDLYLAVDRGRGVRAQVEAGIRAAVRGGRLPAGTRLPSTRALAADLGVTRRVVVEAYDQLAAEGYVSARQGAGTVVNAVPRRAGAAPAAEAGPPLVVDFRPGHPDPALFPRVAWGRATRAAFAGMGPAELDGADRRGLPALRSDPMLACAGSAVLGMTIIGFNLLGDGLRDALDPRSKLRIRQG